jgi:putative ABC transport system permease protein
MSTTNSSSLLAEAVQDVHYALRNLRFNRAFAAIAILTFAVGIGATTAIFSVVNATLFRPLPFREPERLVSLFLRMPVQFGSGEIDMVWSYPKYQAMLGAQSVTTETALHIAESFTVGTQDGAEIVRGESVGADYFSILGISPTSGRFFDTHEDRASGGERVAVLSDGFWRQRFGGAPTAIGSRIEIAGSAYTIVGVAPAGFRGLSGHARIWALYTATRTPQALMQPNMHQFQVIARLAPGVTPTAAKSAIKSAGVAVDAAFPRAGSAAWGATSYTMNELRVDPAVGRSVVVLAGAVSLLLLIACVNLASLLLARGAARRRELAVRLAMGATRTRLVRQLLTESAVLAACGVLAGLLVAFISVHALSATAPMAAANLSTVRGNLTAVSLSGIGLDGGAVAFSIVIALVTAIGAGLAPALAAGRTPLADAMRQGASTSAAFTGLRRLTPRAALVIGEIALAVVLLVTSGLMIRSLSQLFEAQTGYRPDHLLTARVTLDAARISTEPAGAMWNEITRSLSALPGVRDVATGSCSPVGDHCEGTSLELPGRAVLPSVSFHAVSPNYFKTLGIPVMRGRDVAWTDTRDAPVMVINDMAARTIWGSEDPLSKPAGTGDKPPIVVGVVGDVRYENVEAAAKPAVFVPVSQNNRRTSMVFIRTAGDPAALAPTLREAIRAIDRNHAVTDINTMEERMRESTARNRFATQVLAAFAVVALALAALGIYGVLSLAVAQRRRELSVRMALGAERSRVLAMILSEAGGLVAIGALLGAIGAFAASRAMGSLLFGVTGADPSTYAASAAVLAMVAGMAALVPALRAMRVQPAAALRGD